MHVHACIFVCRRATQTYACSLKKLERGCRGPVALQLQLRTCPGPTCTLRLKSKPACCSCSMQLYIALALQLRRQLHATCSPPLSSTSGQCCRHVLCKSSPPRADGTSAALQASGDEPFVNSTRADSDVFHSLIEANSIQEKVGSAKNKSKRKNGCILPSSRKEHTCHL